jgi:intracellular sulfur oxidation DsrE/DsrF family protein
MKNLARLLTVAAALAVGLAFATPGHAEDKAKTHRIVFHVDQNDPALMNMLLNNVSNILEYYHDKGEQAEVEVVANGPGLNMFREDKSPVKDRLKSIQSGSFPSKVAYSACGNTMKGMEKAEGHSIPIVPEAKVVTAGVVRLTELQEAGWTYIRP